MTSLAAVLDRLDEEFRSSVPGTRGQAHVTIRDAGHFLQGEKGEELARVVVEFIDGNP